VRGLSAAHGSQNHGRAYYRCKFPAEYAITEQQHAKTVYVREEAIVPAALDGWLAGLFDDQHLDSTCQALADASQASTGGDQTRQLELH
jgi:hypothetical protein